MEPNLESHFQEPLNAVELRVAKLRELASLLVVTEQKERSRFAKILHDHLQQVLIAAKLGMERLHQFAEEPLLRAYIFQVEDLIEESLTISRKLTMELSPPVLRDGGLITALEWLGRWMKDKHNLDVLIHPDPDQMPEPSEDCKIFLFQSIRELLINTVKHADIRQASVQIQSQDGHLSVVVEDKGKGFNPQQTINPREQFGLFNIRERLEALQCKLEIQSSPGKGARFTFTVPIDDKGTVIPVAVPIVPLKVCDEILPTESCIRILVVDDHKILRQGLIHSLMNCEDMKVIGEASNGQEAVQKAIELEPDIVIMDITMPVLNGIEATRQIKTLKPAIKIIGLSLHDSEDMSEIMRDAGVSAYHCKTAPMDELLQSIRQIFISNS